MSNTPSAAKDLKLNRPWAERQIKFVLLKENNNKITPMTLCYTYRSIPHSAIIRETSCSIWELAHRRTSGQCAQRDMGTLSSEWNVFINLPSDLRDLCGRGSRKIVEGREYGGHQGNSVFQTKQDWLVY